MLERAPLPIRIFYYMVVTHGGSRSMPRYKVCSSNSQVQRQEIRAVEALWQGHEKGGDLPFGEVEANGSVVDEAVIACLLASS